MISGISGILASPGVAIGKVLLIEEQEITLNTDSVSQHQVEAEIQIFYDARKKSKEP